MHVTKHEHTQRNGRTLIVHRLWSPRPAKNIYSRRVSTTLHAICHPKPQVRRSKYVHWPSGTGSSRSSQLPPKLANVAKKLVIILLHLHLALLHGINQLQLTLGHLDDLFDKASANFVLNLTDPACQVRNTSRPGPVTMWCSNSLLSCQLGLILPLDLLVLGQRLAVA